MKIILFNGPPRSGKDTATKMAMDFLGLAGMHYRFATPLKLAVHRLFGLAESTEAFDAVKEKANDLFFGMSPREAYIWMSEKVAKPTFGKDFFTKIAIRTIKANKSEMVVISDCGFQEEAEGLIAEFGKENVVIVFLKRDGATYAGDSRSYLDGLDCQQFNIVNNGQLYNLRQDVERVIEKVLTGAK